MSGYCRATDAQKGFTLIELLVVLTIVGGIAALVAPNGLQSLTRGAQTERRLAVERALMALPDAARSISRTLWLGGDGEDAATPPLPNGLRIEVQGPPIRYRFDGVCAGGRLRVIGDGIVRSYRLPPPYCAPVPE